jgi:hypothetical protein
VSGSEWSPVRGIKHARNMSSEAKKAIGERLAAYRAAKNAEGAA